MLDQDLADGVRDLCAAHQVTPYMLLLAAFATLLYRRSGQDDILLGGPMANLAPGKMRVTASAIIWAALWRIL